MKEFDFTGVPEEIKEAMLGAYKASLDVLESAKEVAEEDATFMQLIGHGVSQAKKMVADVEDQIQKTIDIFQDK